MIEYPKNNIIKEKLKGGDNDKNNNSINISFKSGDWDVRNENSINQIDIKSNSSKISLMMNQKILQCLILRNLLEKKMCQKKYDLLNL